MVIAKGNQDENCQCQELYMAQRPGHSENWSGSNWRALKCGAGGEWRR